MKKISIHIILLGTPRHMSAIKALQAYHSDLFSIQSTSTIAQLPNTDLNDWSYSTNLIRDIVVRGCDANIRERDDNITVAILEHKIENNYFIRRLTDTSAVITFYEVDEILRDVNIDPFNYLLLAIYKLVTLYYIGDSKIASNSYMFAHDDTRNCIFDKTGNKYDIVHSAANACLCQQCENRLSEIALPQDFITTLKREVVKIRKSRYSKIADFIKKFPRLSLLITVVSTIIINILSNVIYVYFFS